MGTSKYEVTKYTLIDSLLDSYNLNIKLYEQYGVISYKERAENFLEILKQYLVVEETESN